MTKAVVKAAQETTDVSGSHKREGSERVAPVHDEDRPKAARLGVYR